MSAILIGLVAVTAIIGSACTDKFREVADATISLVLSVKQHRQHKKMLDDTQKEEEKALEEKVIEDEVLEDKPKDNDDTEVTVTKFSTVEGCQREISPVEQALLKGDLNAWKEYIDGIKNIRYSPVVKPEDNEVSE